MSEKSESSGCPTDEELGQYAKGALGLLGKTRTMAHLEKCLACSLKVGYRRVRIQDRDFRDRGKERGQGR